MKGFIKLSCKKKKNLSDENFILSLEFVRLPKKSFQGFPETQK